MKSLNLLCIALASLPFTWGLRYEPEHVGYNLNENVSAVEPRDYWGQWDNHTFHPSPSNWRFPFYVLTIDRFVDGDPTNNEANGTVFEHDWMSNQFRFGGDVAGVLANLDYLQSMGIKAVYFTGSMMVNVPWSPDGFGPLDFTLLDRHHGNIEEWRNLIDEMHRRGMYVIFDNTMATMGNLLAYGPPYTNATVDFKFGEYDYIWKEPRRQYHDFHPGNEWDPSCEVPHFWGQSGYQEPQNIMDQFTGCRDSEFDMYGDIKGTGAYPSYINQVSRFASVQDRLREWRPDVLEKINLMSCMQIAMLDIDGFRMDKAAQTTLDAMAEFSSYQRQCARRLGKDNFLMVGEVVADPKLSSNYYGRGKTPSQALTDPSLGVHTSNTTDSDQYIRPFGMTALDAAAFHYDIYGSMTRFLGLDGPWGSLGVDWVELWNKMLKTEDLVNANTGLFDPRHLFGTTNQDVFRWPALANGTQRQLLGLFVTVLELPGVPMVHFGEEQGFYILENAAPDYVYGREPLTSTRAWQLHGCYKLGQELYVDMPYESSGNGCHDDAVSLDHRDHSHPMRNILKRFFELREHYPVLNDGFNLTTLSTKLYDVYLRGSQGMPSPHGLWSIYRGRNTDVQDFTGIGHENQPVWLLFHNENKTVTYNFDCASDNNTSSEGALVSAFSQGTTVKNLLYPYDTYDLEGSTFSLGLENDPEANGCLSEITFKPWEFKAFVPISAWQAPRPVISSVFPGHDARLVSTVAYDQTESVPIELGFSEEMDCDSVMNSLTIESATELGKTAKLDVSSVACKSVKGEEPTLVGQVATVWTFYATLENVANGVHTFTVTNATAADGQTQTNTLDKFMFRIGQQDNPMVFPGLANYTRGILHKDSSTGDLFVTPKAAGADLMRYSTNWGSSYSTWEPYVGGNVTLQKQPWSGTKEQEWTGEHVILNFWSKITGSSDHYQHGDLDRDDEPPRRWPHAWVEGVFNDWGYDKGIKNQMQQNNAGDWTFDLYTEWPTNVTINVWGMNPDGRPDKSAAYGDVDRDGVLDWVWPDSLANNFLNISAAPSDGRVGYRVTVNDGNYSYSTTPSGSQAIQAALLVLLCIIPPLTGSLAVKAFMGAFYKIKLNKSGIQDTIERFSWRRLAFWLESPNQAFHQLQPVTNRSTGVREHGLTALFASRPSTPSNPGHITTQAGLSLVAGSTTPRTVLIATMEYEIEDYGVKIKIGGLGVMASLMGKSLPHMNIIWVVPCVGDIDYPFEEGSESEPMSVSIVGQAHLVTIHVHVVRNVTYILLDSPIFRKRTKADPYPPRMDDFDSGMYYSAWNQCIAEAYRRYKPDVYHINDYHGACAPLYLLPDVIPVCLSLHNAEFQGMWPLKTADQLNEVSRTFNLSPPCIRKYVQFGEVFNLLHAAASYLRIHQEGFGAVGVSRKYGQRSLARYPIFWGLSNIGSLPNPDPSDTAPVDTTATAQNVGVDRVAEEQRGEFRKQAQQWAGLEVDPKAELFIFVGRWSMQKGVDLIADVFPSVLEKHRNTQLICVGPVIDLYGKFAALKLEKLMAEYPGRVFSKPEFTALPPYLFSGAEFALMPSRDEPFGLVAVEFGRKGALCVGSRVGGFGQMPGWWFTVESVTSKHLTDQFKRAISSALASDYETRANMRAVSLVQRFPVATWVQDLETLQTKCIEMSSKYGTKPHVLEKLRNASSNQIYSLSNASTTLDLRLSPGTQTPIDPTPGRTPGRTPGVQTPGTPSSEFNPFLDPELLRANLARVADGSLPSTPRRMVTPTFNDSRNTYHDKFSRKLDDTSGKISSKTLRIEDFISKSEKDWFGQLHDASLRGGSSRPSSSRSFLPFRGDGDRTPDGGERSRGQLGRQVSTRTKQEHEELLGVDYEAPRGCKRLLQMKFGKDWYLYCFLLAFGQIVSANATQLTLLTGEVGQAAAKLYTICVIYFIASLGWWLLYRTTKAVYSLSAPFLFFGGCFLLLGFSKATNDANSKNWIYNIATAFYTIGSAANSLFFSLNFGTEGGTPTQTWAFRSCTVAGTQNLLIAFLWYWGSQLTTSTTNSVTASSSAALPAIAIPLACLMFAIGALLYLGLPDYYRSQPGYTPSFYRALFRRSIFLWFIFSIILQNFFLVTVTPRSWLFLWSSRHAPAWGVAILVIIFFGFIWAATLFILGRLSIAHSWIIPIFGVALGAPRWAQILWATSGIGYYIPWAGSLAAGALISRGVWLWLGVLDAIQGVAWGMILMMTLTRLHITCTLVGAQMMGSLVTIIARLIAPSKAGPGDVFVNVLANGWAAKPWFWVGLMCQLIICVGYFKIFRKSQLNKP